MHVQRPDPARDVVDRQVPCSRMVPRWAPVSRKASRSDATPSTGSFSPLPGSARYFFLGATNRGCFGRGARSSKRVMRVMTSDRILLATMVLAAAAALRASVTN